MEIQYIIIGAVFGLFLGFFIAKIVFLGQKKSLQRDAIRGSRNSITGEIYEKILPALPDFPYAPKDMVFIGKGTDYVIFDWLSEWYLREIIFLELKSGKAVLNANEKSIKNTIAQKRVRFSEYRIGSVRNKE